MSRSSAKRPEASLFAGGGEMGALMRATDWSKTKLGPVESWPRSLKTMLGVVLGSRFPMLLWWGPDLLHLYNDAYRPILRDKHPESLAAPAAEVWSEVWGVAGPMAKGVLDGGPATWTEDLQLFISNGGMLEETYFTFSYSPVPGDDGRVGGLLNTVQETTVKVQSERQIRMLHDLAARTADVRQESAAHRLVLEVLSGNALDLPFCLLYLFDEAGERPRLAGSYGWDGPPDGARWPFGETVVVDLSTRFGPLPPGRWNARPERAVLLPLTRAGRATSYACLVAGVSPHRALDERYMRFFHAAADQVMTVIANARAYETETRRAEALTELDRAKTTFFSNISHELRTPLTLILGPLEDALTRSPASLAGEDLSASHRNAVRLLKLVNSLLDFARIEAGRLQMTFAPTDLGAVTSELASSFRSLAERGGLKLVVDCARLAEPVYVDVEQWEKIVLNLVSNAFKFTLNGEIRVSLRDIGDAVELSVRDTGVGIPPGELPRVFERFHRVEGTHARGFEGTGIGLSLVKELARLHGGTIDVTSAERQGSEFRVKVPKGAAHLPSERVTHAPAEGPASGATVSHLLEAGRWTGINPSATAAADSPGPSAASQRILVVDDNADMRRYLSRLLAGRWHVDVAGDGLAALDMARANRPDLVLSDVMMPRMDGVALLKALRAEAATRDVPVILLSARAGEESILEGLETGADDYLVKPFSARELLARVRTHLDMACLRREWTLELERTNHELETFSYSVSHDLRAPLRTIDGFTKALLQEDGRLLSPEGRRYVDLILKASKRMTLLIDDLLKLSRVSRSELEIGDVDLTAAARKILSGLRVLDKDRAVETRVQDGLLARADARLLTVALENLLGNAWKFTSKRGGALIEVGLERLDGRRTFYVRDNGAGFDMEYADRLFTPFQRLHSDAEFEGTGVGLATVHRIVTRHGGSVWVEAAPGAGATFRFTLEQ